MSSTDRNQQSALSPSAGPASPLSLHLHLGTFRKPNAFQLFTLNPWLSELGGFRWPKVSHAIMKQTKAIQPASQNHVVRN